MKELRILVTGVGSLTAESIIKSYKIVKERKIYIVGVDIKDFVPNEQIDKFYKILKPTENNYIDNLLDICKEEKIEFIVPLVDQELEILAENKDIFLKNNINICINNKEIIQLIQNKYDLYKYLETNGIDVPKSIKFNNLNEFIGGCKQLDYAKNTICYKPLMSSGSRGFKIIKNDINYEDYLVKNQIQNI